MKLNAFSEGPALLALVNRDLFIPNNVNLWINQFRYDWLRVNNSR